MKRFIDNLVSVKSEKDFNNIKLPFSIWLAGYNDGNEWEVRLEDETKVKILSCKEI